METPINASGTLLIKEAIVWATYERELPLYEALVLLSHSTGFSKEHIFQNDNDYVDIKAEALFKSLVEKRAKGVPIAYLRNKKEFFGLEFYVDENVLVPRPETELLVEIALKKITENIEISDDEVVTVADIGTGSGAIALSIAHHVSAARVFASDISSQALEVAAKNAEKIGVSDRVKFLEGDLLEPLIQAGLSPNLIVANLPYIAKNDVENVSPNVHAHEPHLALYSGETGIEHYERLFLQLQRLEKFPRFIIGEIGVGQSDLIKYSVVKILINNYRIPSCSIFPDLAGIPRVFLISFHSQK